jgi:superfamily II DNA or RNA helicase
MHKFVTHDGYLLEKSKLTNAEVQKIKTDLTINPIVLQSYAMLTKPKPMILYKQSPNYFILPRFYGIETFGNPIKEFRSIGEEMNKNVVFTYSLLPHQITAEKKTYDTLINYNGGILCLPCGFGKTGISIYLSIKLKRKTAIIVNKEFLADQWISAINKFTGGTASIGRIQGTIYDIENKDFVICMIQTFCQKEYLYTDLDKFGMFILDECHHMGSEMFSKALTKIRSKYVLGLSATPERKDGLTKVFEYHIGKICHSEKRQNLNLIEIKRITLDSDSPEYETLFMANGVKNTSGMITALSKSKKRNELLIEIIRLLMKEPRKILFLSDRREHLEQIYDLLKVAKIKTIKGEDITFGYYMGNKGTNKKTHRDLLDTSSKCDVILGTFHISSEGLDIPDLNTEILATSHTDVQQSVGRILRKNHDISPIVVDMVDKCGNFVNQSYSRNKYYKSENYNIYNHKIKLDTFNNDNLSKLAKFIKSVNDDDDRSDISENIDSDDSDEKVINQCLL